MSRVRSIANSQATEPLEPPGDDLLAELEHEVNRLIRATDTRLQERLLFSVGPVVVFRWINAAGWPVEYVSPNVETLTGYPVAELASGQRAYASLIHPEDLARVFEEVKTNSESGVAWFVHRPYRILRADGSALWIGDYTVILRGASGQITHYFGYIMDISAQVDQLARLQAQAQLITELSSPILQVGRGVLAMPLMGTFAADRAARMTAELLTAVTDLRARTVILDLTGLQDIDAQTMELLLRTNSAVALLGCRCILCGISPKTAKLIVGLGKTSPLKTVATLQDALELARAYGV